MVFMFRGTCDFKTKVEHAVAAGAVALVIINHDQTRPDHAFSMTHPTSTEGTAVSSDLGTLPSPEEALSPQIPCVMVSWNSGQAILEDRPERLRLYPGGGRPFIESVSDESPVVFIIHNLLSQEEIEFLKDSAKNKLRPSTTADDDVIVKQKAPERSFDTAYLRSGVWKGAVHKAMDEKLFSIINFPPDYFGDLQVNRFSQGGHYGLHYDSDRRASVYREKIMTVVFCLDDVDASRGGGITFPRGGLHVRPHAGMAMVYHNSLEDGSLDPKSSHLYENLTSGVTWTATLHVYAAPTPLARRMLVPLLAMLNGGEEPGWLRDALQWAVNSWGADKGTELFHYALLAVAALAVLLLLAAVGAVALRSQKAATRPKVE